MRSAYGQHPATPRGVGRHALPPNRPWLGWIGAALGIGAIVFVIGRAGLDSDVPLGSTAASPAGPLEIRFGSALDANSGEVSEPLTQFRAGDTVAWSVRLSGEIGTDTILVEVVRFDGDAPTTVQEPTGRGVDPHAHLIAFSGAAGDMLAAWGPGEFEMRLYREAGAAPLAAGRFTLAETPAAS